MCCVVWYEMHHNDTGVTLGSLLFGQNQYYTTGFLKMTPLSILHLLNHIDTVLAPAHAIIRTRHVHHVVCSW